jgi:hypothetical protein
MITFKDFINQWRIIVITIVTCTIVIVVVDLSIGHAIPLWSAATVGGTIGAITGAAVGAGIGLAEGVVQDISTLAISDKSNF